MRCFHGEFSFYPILGGMAGVCLLASFAFAGNAEPPKISRETRQQIIHAFTDELIYIHTSFPMGKTGLKLKDGTLSPSGEDLDRLMALWGPAAKPGDRARISDVIIKEDHIRFDINGGPVNKQKWYKRIQVSGGTGVPVGEDESANPRGSYVDLYFDKYVPDLTGPELKELLRPVFDFDAKSALEAYLESVSPQAREAIKNHHVLVGMNQEMVLYAKGRPPKKVRERAEDVEYEEWIYGMLPQDVDFVRFVGGEVVRVETMKVDGQKIVRVDKEIDLGASTVAKKASDEPTKAPTLRRPGEEMPESDPTLPGGIPPLAPVPPPSGPGSDPGPNWLGSQPSR